jgi:CDP-glucose 4,6-dehydratase
VNIEQGRSMTGAVDPDFWNGRRVLLTGHTGFKGAWLSLWLQSLGARVTGFSSGVPTKPSLYELARVGEGLHASVQGDVRNPQALAKAVAAAGPEVVIHLAAQPLVRRSFTSPRETFETNVMGTVNVLDAVRHSDDLRAVVIVTSDKCYENREHEHPYLEQDPMGGHDPYSASKGAAELVTSAYRRSFFQDPNGPRVASARAGNVIGGGDWGEDRLVPDIVRAAHAGDTLRVRNPGAVRPWQHVLCPLNGYLMLAQALCESPEHADAWNFGPNERDAQTVGWIVERFSQIWPGGVRWTQDEGPHPHEAHHLKLDSSRACERLGWRPVMGLEEGIEATAAWYEVWQNGADLRGVTLRQISDACGSDLLA